MMPFISKLAWYLSDVTKASNSDHPPTIINVMITGAAFALACFAFVILTRPKHKATPPLPPGPIGFPVVGYMPFLGSNLVHTFTRLSTTYGPITKLRLGSKLVIVLSSPAIVKEVVKDQDLIFANRDPNIASLIASYGCNDISFASYGPEWRKSRKLFVSEMMSKANLDASSHIRAREIKKASHKLYDNRNNPVDIGELSLLTLVNVVMSMVWGETVKGVKRADVEAKFRGMAEELTHGMIEPNISDFIPMLARFDLQGVARKMTKVSAFFDNFFDSVIDEYHKMKNHHHATDGDAKKKDFIHVVMQRKDTSDQQQEKSLSLLQVKGLFLDIIAGGTDTTAVTVEWVMTELLRHPEEMKKAQKELEDVVGLDNIVEEFHLSKLKYLQAIVKETLRLHPPVPLLVPRRPSSTTTIGGYIVPEGSQIFINAYAIHRDPKLWENPLEFRPERFVTNMGDNSSVREYMGNNLELIPFGSGRRMCPGIPLAQRLYMLLLGAILHSFEWKLPDGEILDVEEQFGIVFKKLRPLIAIPTPRLSSLELYE